MKRGLWMALILALLLLCLPVRALAAPPGLLVIGSSYTLESGETLEEDLTIIGGNVVIESEATVDGSILLMGGTLHVSGRVTGSITAGGGVVELADTAVVEGDVSTAGAALSQAEGARVEGSVVTETGELLANNRSANWQGPAMIKDLLSPLAFFARSLVVAALAVLAAMFFPQPVERVARALAAQPLLSGGMGVLTVLVFLMALILTIITILLIPLGLFGLLTLAFLYLFGWIAFGYEVGRRSAEMFHWDLAAPVSAGIGTLLISLVFGGIGSIPCLGWLIAFLVWHAALGAVLLTRFGTQAYMDGFPPRGVSPIAPIPPPPSEGWKVVEEPPASV